jgi:beta-lactamase class A
VAGSVRKIAITKLDILWPSRVFDTIAPMTELETFIREHKDKILAVALHDFETGQEILINADESFHPASTIKVHVMMEVFHQAEQGSLSLDDCLRINNSFSSIADETKFSLLESDDAEQTLYHRIGESESIAELTRLMILRSSNLATNILLEKIGVQNVNPFIQTLGIEGVSVIRGIEDQAAFRRGMNNSATARGLTQTMKLIAEKQVVSQHASEKMIEIMLQQEFNQSIPALLPKSVNVAHKTGWTGDVYHDTGIILPENRKPYALSIMTRGFAEDREDEAHTCMANISKIIYEKLQ